MTSPADAALKRLEDAVQAPVSLGWIAAHVMKAGGTSAAAWRDPLALARSAAAGMAGMAGMAGITGIAGLSFDSLGEGVGAAEFVKPFRAASDVAGLIRDPLKPRTGRPQSGFGALTEAMGAETGSGPAESGKSLSDGLAAQTLSGMGGESKPDLGDLGSLGVAGAFAALAYKGIEGIGDPFPSASAQSPSRLKASAAASRHRGPDGNWVETGPSTTRNGTSASPHGRTAQSAHSAQSGDWPRSTPGPQSVPAARTRNKSADTKSAVNGSGAAGSMRAPFTISAISAIGATGTTPSLPPAQTEFEIWAERVTRKLARFVAGTASASGRTTVSATGNPAPSKRALFLFPEDPETLARFKKLMEAHAQVARESGSPATSGSALDGGLKPPGALGAPEAPGANAREATPGIGPRAGESGSDRIAPVAPPIDLSGLADELYAPARPTTRNPIPNSDAGPASQSNAHRIAPRSAAVPGTAAAGEPMPPNDSGSGIGSGNAASVKRHGQSQVEWMDEEDDLAAKLHRLLRRQAKRHGVELP